MRKYRGKTKSSNKWVYGYVRYFESEDKYFIEESIEGYVYEVVKDTIGQFTGLLDKNKNEIFEGDIVRLQSGGGLFSFASKEFIGIVKFKIGGGIRNILCQFYIETINDEYNEADFNPQNIEIIGNIHDNLELLNEV